MSHSKTEVHLKNDFVIDTFDSEGAMNTVVLVREISNWLPKEWRVVIPIPDQVRLVAPGKPLQNMGFATHGTITKSTLVTRDTAQAIYIADTIYTHYNPYLVTKDPRALFRHEMLTMFAFAMTSNVRFAVHLERCMKRNGESKSLFALFFPYILFEKTRERVKKKYPVIISNMVDLENEVRRGLK